MQQSKIACKTEKITPTECFLLLKGVYSDHVMSRSMEGQDEAEDNKLQGHLSISKTDDNVEKIYTTYMHTVPGMYFTLISL